MNLEIVAFIIYFLLMLCVGFSVFLKEKGKTGEKEFFLGGRKMGPWVTAMSAQASDMSAWLLMGLPGSILAFGLGQAWIGIGLAIGTALNWILVAKRLRKFSRAAGDSITLPQYLSNRFCANNHTLSIICAVVFLLSFTIYVASAYVAGASVFTAVFPELNERVAMLVFAGIILIYTFLGGFKAVCWTDFVQGLMILAALIAIPTAIAASGNVDASRLSEVIVNSKDGTRYEFVSNLFRADLRDILSGLGWGLGYFGMPHIIVRFMSIEKPSMVNKSAIVAIIWVIVSLICAILIAYYGRMIVGQELLAEGNQKLVFISLVRKCFPTFIAGLLLSGIIAASMSTADSQLLVASSAFTSDIYKPIFRKQASDRELLTVGRIVILVVAVIAFFIADSKGSGAQAIMDLVENAWGIFGASFGPVVLLSLFWKRFTYQGAVAGIIAGALVDILWLAFLSETGIYEIIPGFIVGFAAAVIASKLDSEPSAEICDVYNRATDPENDD